MSRTTELLKGIKSCKLEYPCEICGLCHAELKGRLSVLKELNKFILDNKKKETLFILNETLRKIQKEIKEVTN
jgi:hypothetical protein